MNLFDAHCHLQDPRIYGQIDVILAQAQRRGVGRLMCCGTTEADWPVVTALANKHPAVSCAMGIHPWFVDDLKPGWQVRLADQLDSRHCGVGEIGLDFLRPKRAHARQVRVFKDQLRLAIEFQRAASIHCRQAWGALLDCLQEIGKLPAGAMLHAFGGSIEVARQAMRQNCWISVGGSLTRPNAHKLRKTIAAIPLDRLLIETDSPDIRPHGAPPGPNVPANLRLVLDTLSKLHHLPVGDIARRTFQNATALFGT